jgi:uncharacterized surface protein with fasciclin (FAS1) repeats
MRNMRTAQRGGLLATALMVAALGTACGSDDEATDVGLTTDETTAAEEPMEEETTEESEPSEEPSEDMTDDMSTDLVGAGCAGYAEAVPDGAGSVEGMAMDPVATAASNNPLLTTLTAAVSGGVNPNVNLVDTLNGDEFTVFAPVDDAFAKLDAATLEALGADDGTLLSTVLTYHVLPGQMAPDALVGAQTTVQGEDLEVAGEGDTITVNGTSAVICGNVKTANATVYLIDTVLMPPSMM